jgi:hypothetical protein
MTDVSEVEVVIGTRDEAAVAAIEAGLDGVEVTRWRDARFVDPVTVLAVGAGVVKLIKALVGLKQQLDEHPDAPSVVIRTADGKSITLKDATPELLAVALGATAAL